MKKVIHSDTKSFYQTWVKDYFPKRKAMAYYKMFEIMDGSQFNQFRTMFPDTVALSMCPGGSKMHHIEPGGLLRHYDEMIYWMMNRHDSDLILREINFSNIIEAVILHDISKPLFYRSSTQEEYEKDRLFFRYVKRERNVPMLNDDLLTCFIINYFKLDVSWEVFVAVLFAEGGWSDAAKMQGCQPNQLGYFLHMADLYSSQFLGRKFEAGGLAK